MNWRMSSGPDWGDGAYEKFAPALEDAADHLIRIAAPLAGERAVDLGCGSGNATLPLAAAGTQVTAIDPSLRLLGLTTERAREAGHRITTAVAGAELIPLPDGDADLVVSNFGIIFATDPAAAIGEVLRILSPDGRFVYTAWQPFGAIAEIATIMRAAAGQVAPGHGAAEDGDTPGTAWHDPTTFADRIPGEMESVVVHEAETDFVADSADAWLRQQAEHHPMWMAARAHLSEDVWDQVMRESSEVLSAGSRSTDRLVVSAPYVVVEIHPRR